MRVGVAVAFSLFLVSNEASAAALGGLAASVGFFAALVTLILSKSGAPNAPVSGWPALIGALSIVGGAAWIWRVRIGSRISAFLPSSGSGSVATLRSQPEPDVVLPPALGRAQLLKEMRLLFVELQSAWDLRETESLRKLTTPDMLREFWHEGQDCSSHCRQQSSEVVMLRADLLGFEDLASALVVTVEFSGLMRDGPERGADPFRELWMLTKVKHGAESWRLARHQALL
jgi:hypothetical protein